MKAANEGARPIAILRWPFAAMLAALAILPFLFTAIPPLTDVPGHLGGFAVQTAHPGDPLLRYFSFHWTLTLNLASDLIVQATHRWIGLFPAVWLMSALTPALTVLGIVAIARQLNRHGASALPWALLFVFNFPFLWGFLNYSFTLALALLAFAGWLALERSPGWRAPLFLAIVPLLLIGHGVAGIVCVGLIVSHAIGETLAGKHPGNLTRLWPPILATVATVVIWKLFGASGTGATHWLAARKGDALAMMLRDQNRILDLASVVAALLVALAGWLWGARLRGGALAAVLFVIVLLVATPSMVSGSDRLDTRLGPLIPMLVFAAQDWSRVDARRRRMVTAAGFALLALRFAVTTASFIGYGERYNRELAALDHVPQGARILNLTRVNCVDAGWRSERLEHLANLATPLRGAWVNAHWSIDGLQLLQVRYRPSADYAQDPSQLVWPARCIDFSQPFASRSRHTLVETIPTLPLDKVDYLWLVGERLPPSARDPRWRLIWADDISELYATRPASPVTPAPSNR